MFKIMKSWTKHSFSTAPTPGNTAGADSADCYSVWFCWSSEHPANDYHVCWLVIVGNKTYNFVLVLC